ncbi:MAG: hypothetical protein RSB20_01585 [Clostridia bacterium]
MTREELLENRQFLDAKDITKMFCCGLTTAYSIINGIKSVSDIGNRAGRILVRDYENWLSANGQKKNNG